MCLADKNLVQRDRWLQLVKESSVLGLKIFLASLGKNATEHQQLHSLCFIGNQFENGIERAPGPSKKSSKNCQNSNGSLSSSYLIDGRQCFDKHSSEPMIFVNFSDL